VSAEERPRREVAHRVFAAEYNDATYTYRESDEERAPNYLVTPSGARVNRLFLVGVLTEVEAVGEEVLRARVVDPTGAFVVYAGQYQPDALAFFEDAAPPTFVAVTGKANTFQPDDSDRIFTSVRPESVTAVDAETRDRWVVGTAERTVDRMGLFATALDRDERGDSLRAVLTASDVAPSLAAGIPNALAEYGTTPAYLDALRGVAIDAVRVVAGDIEEVPPLDVAPDEGDGTATDLTVGATVPTLVDATEAPAAADRTVEEPAPDPGSVGETVGTDAGAGAPAEAEPAAEPGETVEREADTGGTGAGTSDPETGDAELYELDEDEREEVEAEYGVEFSSGEDIPDAGEADIETPTPDSDPDQEAADADSAAPDSGDEAADDNGAPDGEPDEAVAEGSEAADGEPDEAGGDDTEDLEDLVVERMRALADGGGADRSTLVEGIAEERDVDPAAVEDAIQAALMSGRCYESGEDELTPI